MKRKVTLPDRPSAHAKVPLETILKYVSKGYSQADIARLTNVNPSAISQRLAALDIQSLPDFHEHKASIYDIVERKHLTKLVDGESKQPMVDMTVAAIAGDKGRIIRGQATAIIEVRQLKLDLDKAFEVWLKARGEAGGVDG